MKRLGKSGHGKEMVPKLKNTGLEVCIHSEACQENTTLNFMALKNVKSSTSHCKNIGLRK